MSEPDRQNVAPPEGVSTPDMRAPLAIRDIADRLSVRPENPVTRARAWVEREVPEAQRGPGWDRHWRELEAYVDSAAIWARPNEADAAEEAEESE